MRKRKTVFLLLACLLLTLAAGLAMLIGEHTTYYEQVMAGGIIAVLPLIVLFLIFRKKIMEGVSRGGVKG